MLTYSGGLRHDSADGGPGNLDAHIEESWIYGVVLDQDEIKNLIEATGIGGADGTAENAVYDQDQSGTSASNNPHGPP